MVRVRLTVGRSWSGLGLNATRDKPIIECDDEKAAALIASGHFVLADDEPEEDPDTPTHATNRAITSYDLMPVAEVRKKAQELGIATKGLSKAKLLDAIAKATIKELPPHEGSFAMIALQEEQ